MSELNLGFVPSWSLSDLYRSVDDAAIDADIQSTLLKVNEFCTEYKGLIARLQPDALFNAIKEYEEIEKLLSKLYVFAYLNFCVDMSNEKGRVLLQKIKDIYSQLAAKITFFTIEINDIPDDRMSEMLSSNSRLVRFAPYLRDVRRFKPHLLSQEMESLLVQTSNTGVGSVVRLFDEHLTRLRFNIKGERLNISKALDLISDSDRNIRKEAGLEIGRVFKENAWFYTIVINTIANDKKLIDEYRRYETPISARNLTNFIEDDVVKTLVESVKTRYANISHRYYAMKAKLLGLEKMEFYDRNAPLPISDDQTYTFEEAKSIVLRAYYDFSQDIGKIVEMFFDNNWIDAKIGDFKASGAFCCATTSDLHPYVMMNYNGKARDIATLAHELGHGVHMYLSRSQGQLMQDTPLTLAETASVFGEQLVFRALLRQAQSAQQRLVLMCQKIEDSISTVVRQIAFLEFEKRLHEARKVAELTEEEICQIWLAVQGESLGDAINLSEEYKFYWVYISHFIHSPFYVYAYSFGDLLVNALYKTYLEQSVEDFQEKYIQMLSAGGTLHHRDLLRPFKLDARDEKFWHMGLDVIDQMIAEVEGLCESSLISRGN